MNPQKVKVNILAIGANMDALDEIIQQARQRIQEGQRAFRSQDVDLALGSLVGFETFLNDAASIFNSIMTLSSRWR